MQGIANRHGSRNSQRFYLLTGMLYCSCGERIHGANKRYVCSSWSRRNRVEPRTCREPSIKAEALEAFVWSRIYELLTDTDTLKERLRAARDGMVSLIHLRLDEMKIVATYWLSFRLRPPILHGHWSRRKVNRS